MNLSILPSEILLQIIELLTNERDINALVQTCRHTYTCLNFYLYQHCVQHGGSPDAMNWAVFYGEEGAVVKLLEQGSKVEMEEDEVIAGPPWWHELDLEINYPDTEYEDDDGLDKYHDRLSDEEVFSDGEISDITWEQSSGEWYGPKDEDESNENGDREEEKKKKKKDNDDQEDEAGEDADGESDENESEDEMPLEEKHSESNNPRPRSMLYAHYLSEKDRDWHVPYKRPPLSTAAGQGNVSMLKLLLDNGASPGIRDKRKMTPLILGAREGHKEIVEALLEKGRAVDINAEDNWGFNAFSAACEYGHIEIVNLLLARDDLVFTLCPELVRGVDTSPLSCSIRGNNLEIFSLLLNYVDLEHMNYWQRAFTMALAAKTGNDAIVRVLIDNGFEAGIPYDEDSMTPLAQAARHGHINVVKMLLNTGINLSMPSGRFDETPLHIAAACGEDQIMQLLIDCGANLQAVDYQGNQPIHSASLKGKPTAVELLVKHAASLDIQNAKGKTPLFLACDRGHSRIVSILLTHGADPDIRDEKGDTASIIATKQAVAYSTNSHFAVLEQLIQAGFDFQVEDRDFRTPLSHAIKNEKVFQFLLNRIRWNGWEGKAL